MILISIIIVNYNTKNLLHQCLSSIYDKTQGVNFEIIVVDNNSEDGSEELVRNKFPDVLLIQSGENIGFGRANNLGIEKSNGEYVFLLNSDTILINNAVKILFDYMVANLEVGVCGGNLFDKLGNPAISFNQLMPSIFDEVDPLLIRLYSRVFYGKNIFFNYTSKPMILDGFISGADMMIRKSVLEKVGLFDSDFFMYYEETELTWRIKRAGYKISSVPSARIIHLEGASETIKKVTITRMIKSKFLYFDKTNKKIYIHFTFLIFFFTSFSRIFYYYFRRNKNRVSYWVLYFKLNLQEYKEYKKSKI